MLDTWHSGSEDANSEDVDRVKFQRSISLVKSCVGGLMNAGAGEGRVLADVDEDRRVGI